MNLLYVVHYPVFGGPHNRAVRLHSPLAERRWQTIVLLPDEPGNAAERLQQSGVEVVKVPLHRLREKADPRLHFRLALSFPREIARIRRLLRERHIDVVLVNGLVNPHAAIAARLEKVPVVWQILDTRTPKTLRRVMMPLVARLSHVVMTTGMEVARVHPGAIALSDRLIPFFPPVDTDLFLPSDERRVTAREELGLTPDDLVIGNVSNVNPQKGHRTFIRAAAALRQMYPDLRFVILGATYSNHAAYAEALWREAASLGLSFDDNLIVRDPGSRVAALAPAFDVFWLTSEPRSEGIPTVVEEAMALALPVVTVDVGAVREAVEDGVTGYIVPPLDPQAIADTTILLLRDFELRARMGAEGRRRAVERFDVEVCADAHIRAFETAIAHAANRRKRGKWARPGSDRQDMLQSSSNADVTQVHRTVQRLREEGHSAMVTARFSRVKVLGQKVAHLAPQIIARPRLLPLMRKGVHPEHYARLDVDWLKEANVKTVLDIGANTGQFTGAIHAVLPDAVIYAFEPLADCHQLLEQRFADEGNVQAIHTALGDEDGETIFHRNAFSQSSSILSLTHLHRQAFPWAAESETTRVPIRRLDSFLTELELQPSILVKLDVQGYEDRVLRGGEQVIRVADYMFVETSFEPLYEGQAIFATVYELMVGYGFRYAGNLDQVTSPNDGRALYADALFIRNRG